MSSEPEKSHRRVHVIDDRFGAAPISEMISLKMSDSEEAREEDRKITLIELMQENPARLEAAAKEGEHRKEDN